MVGGVVGPELLELSGNDVCHRRKALARFRNVHRAAKLH